MLKKIYVLGGATLVAGYMTWSAFGLEWVSKRPERVPTVSANGQSSGRSSTRFFGFGYGGGGK